MPLGARNPRLKHLRALTREPARRRAEGRYVIEGPALVAEALDAPVATVEALYAEPGDPLVERGERAGVEAWATTPGVLAGCLATRTPQPVAAIVTRPDVGTGVVAGSDLVLVLAGVSDPGNLGTLLRAAEASGAGAAVTTPGSTDPFAPKAVRASAGSVLRVPVAEHVVTNELVGELRRAGHRLVVAEVSGSVAYDAIDLCTPVAVVVGHETTGVDREVVAAMREERDVAVGIPLVGPTESLNVAMAGTVVLFEALRQRRHTPTVSGAGR